LLSLMYSYCLILLLTTPPPTQPTLLPYTTLFRSDPSWRGRQRVGRRGVATGGRAYFGRPAARRVRAIRHVHRRRAWAAGVQPLRSEEHTSELQSRENLVCRLLLEKKNRSHSERQR